jgi:CRISPR/Cas system CMR-associated protein Cmr3 (group 5 of RAMP superfamily)
MSITKYVVKDIHSENNYVKTCSGYSAIHNDLFTTNIDKAYTWKTQAAAKGFITTTNRIMTNPHYAGLLNVPGTTYDLIVVPVKITTKE